MRTADLAEMPSNCHETITVFKYIPKDMLDQKCIFINLDRDGDLKVHQFYSFHDGITTSLKSNKNFWGLVRLTTNKRPRAGS